MDKHRKVIIEGEFIEIKGKLNRDEIVKRVINVFIETEAVKRGFGIKFRYPVENLSTGGKLYIFRPAGLNKWNFDFKVDVLEEFGLGKGTHNDIVSDFKLKKNENPNRFGDFLKVFNSLYTCSENDVDYLLESNPYLMEAFQSGSKLDILLKVVKWMFIMEDIVYWNYKGRTKLYEFIIGSL